MLQAFSPMSQDVGMSVLEKESAVKVVLTEKDRSDIAALRQPANGLHHDPPATETSEELLRRVMLAGIEKLREEQAEASYAALADDAERSEYHSRRRAGRRARQ